MAEYNPTTQFEKMYVVSADMGYGHQRAAYPFLEKAEGGIITINDYPGISEEEKDQWNKMRKQYEKISFFKNIPVVGRAVFSVMDYFQRIEPFYPRRDLSHPSFQQCFFSRMIKEGVGRKLIEKLNQKPLPLLATFFVAAQAAEYYNYKGDIYLVVCDADVARAWAPTEPDNSRIIYLAPNQRVKERLLLYGVRADKIYVTGFPLPKTNIGTTDEEYLKQDLKERLEVLDPNGVYRKKYAKLIESYLCPVSEIDGAKRSLSLTFAVGGAGAQRDLGVYILERLKNKIIENKIELNLVAGNRADVYEYYQKALKDNYLQNYPNVRIIYDSDKLTSFKKLNEALRRTDLLWTKPSELSFYCGLGLPIVITEPLGSQEEYNRRWLLGIGAGVDSKNPKYADEWLFDFLNSGWLAEAAMRGYMNAPKMGVYNIENIVLRHQINEIEKVRLL
ncbi:MAG TPA: hypothetical protein PKI61_01395 [bacterium]|nr:hypothetical protein [bacterium]HPT29541.1 hypothetical protein [bacterium]